MGFIGRLLINLIPVALGYYIIAPAIGAGIAANKGPQHAEYHFNGELNGQTVSYGEQNKRSIVHSGYFGSLEVLDRNLTGYRWVDWNNNLNTDKGDGIVLVNREVETRMRVDPANPNIEKIVRQLQPEIDATLERILQQNTAALRK